MLLSVISDVRESHLIQMVIVFVEYLRMHVLSKTSWCILADAGAFRQTFQRRPGAGLNPNLRETGVDEISGILQHPCESDMRSRFTF